MSLPPRENPLIHLKSHDWMLEPSFSSCEICVCNLPLKLAMIVNIKHATTVLYIIIIIIILTKIINQIHVRRAFPYSLTSTSVCLSICWFVPDPMSTDRTNKIDQITLILILHFTTPLQIFRRYLSHLHHQCYIWKTGKEIKQKEHEKGVVTKRKNINN